MKREQWRDGRKEKEMQGRRWTGERDEGMERGEQDEDMKKGKWEGWR